MHKKVEERLILLRKDIQNAFLRYKNDKIELQALKITMSDEYTNGINSELDNADEKISEI